MRICLFWNETAGGGISLDELTSQLTGAGHDVARVVERGDDLAAHVRDGFDCIAAAGGDGTIASAARTLAGGDVPLAILPLGTANNIASSLAIEGHTADLIARWSLERVARIDVGVVSWSGRDRYFLESVGVGLVTDAIDRARQTVSKDDPETHLEDARHLYVEMLARQQPCRHAIAIGDAGVSGDYLLVEALNTSLIGPGLNLTAGANAADGLLSVVAVTDVDRNALSRYLESLRDGSTADAGFHSWRAPEVILHGASRVHVDDMIEPVAGSVAIRIAPGALPILA